MKMGSFRVDLKKVVDDSYDIEIMLKALQENMPLNIGFLRLIKHL